MNKHNVLPVYLYKYVKSGILTWTDFFCITVLLYLLLFVSVQLILFLFWDVSTELRNTNYIDEKKSWKTLVKRKRHLSKKLCQRLITAILAASSAIYWNPVKASLKIYEIYFNQNLAVFFICIIYCVPPYECP